MRTFRLFCMAALALVMAACSSEDSALENATPATTGTMKFTATLAAPGGGATTRTTYTEVTEGDDAGTIKVAWETGDQIYLLNMNNTQNSSAVFVGTIADDGSASISGNIPAGKNGDQILAYYLPSITGDDIEDYMLQQAGTLKYIQDNLDIRAGIGKLSVSGDKATLSDKLQMVSGIAIWKLTLQNSSEEELSATKVTIKKGSDVLAATADISATPTVYLAVPFGDDGLSNADITIEATVGSDKYSFSKSGVTLERGKYYQSTVKMAKAAAAARTLAEATAEDIGKVAGADGNIYDSKDAASTAGTTAVAMIAYVGLTGHATYNHGLALALEDMSTKLTWDNSGANNDGKTAAEWCSAWNTSTPVTDAEWLLASKDQWNYMLGTDGAGSYTGLRDGFESVGGSNMKKGSYWSSTEDGTDNAWDYSFSSFGGQWFSSFKNSNNYNVRACLAF